MDLSEFFQTYPKAALAFSGGCDSAYLLGAAKKYGCDIKPYFIKTQFQPQFEYEEALRAGRQCGIPVTVIQADILQNQRIAANPADRCYECKRQIMRLIREKSLMDGYETLLDGTNASDKSEERPGMKALQEADVLSPLRLCGLSKSAVRLNSKALGLMTWDKPSYACLATRIPTNQPITGALLQAIENSENELRSMGFSGFRLRVYHEAARLQLRAEEMPQVIKQKDAIRKKLQPYFSLVLLDLEERNNDG